MYLELHILNNSWVKDKIQRETVFSTELNVKKMTYQSLWDARKAGKSIVLNVY